LNGLRAIKVTEKCFIPVANGHLKRNCCSCRFNFFKSYAYSDIDNSGVTDISVNNLDIKNCWMRSLFLGF
jgi:hypothetical protein